MLPLAALRVVGGVRKCWLDFAALVAKSVPAAMIEVKMRIDDDVDLLAPHAHGFEFAQKLCFSVVDGCQFLWKFVANAGLDEDSFAASAHQHRIGSAGDPVQRVSFDFLFPQWFGDYAEQASGIEVISSIRKNRQLERAQLSHWAVGCTHLPPPELG